MALSKSDYTQYLNDRLNPSLDKVWGIVELCEQAQLAQKTTVGFNTTDNPPQLVPLAVVTYLTQKYQWVIDADNLPNQMRRINKITLI